MKKRLSVSYRQEKPIKKKVRTISGFTVKNKKQIRHLAKMHDAQIDYSDIPELDFEQLPKPAIGKFYRPLKKQISIRLDADVLEWFKHTGGKYQARINRVCREYMQLHSGSHKTTKQPQRVKK